MDDIERIRLHLQKRHANFFVRAYLQVMLGLALSAVAPCLIVIFVAVICRLWRWNMPTSWVALAAAAVTLPWLFWTEIQAQGGLAREVTDEFNAAEQKKADPPTFAHLGTLGKALARQRTPISGPMEILLFGPNLVVSAMRKLRLRRLSEPAGAERIVQVADALCKLQGGAATEKLLEPKETPGQLSEVLAYLLFFDWIGVASDGSKVWILTEARKELTRAH